MRIFNKVWLVSKAKIILIGMIAVLLISLYLYWNGPQESKLLTLLGGVTTGLFLVIIQYMFSWDEHIERDKLRLLGLKKVLEHKRERTYYGQLIKSSRRRIDLMGQTCRHFFEDFANPEGAHDEARFLMEALARDVEVRILLPESAKKDNENTIAQINLLSSKFCNFSCRFFNHEASHSIFAADKDVIIGPYFPGIKSMDTPALHINEDAVLSKQYLSYFEETWKIAV